jgi:hypothetical protein
MKMENEIQRVLREANALITDKTFTKVSMGLKKRGSNGRMCILDAICMIKHKMHLLDHNISEKIAESIYKGREAQYLNLALEKRNPPYPHEAWHFNDYDANGPEDIHKLVDEAYVLAGEG